LFIFIYRWNTFRSVCNFEKKLGLALEITADIPSQTEIDRWLGEPIKCLVLPTTIFITNKKGFPVLSRPHQTLLKTFASLELQIVIRGNCKHADYKHYQLYLDYVWKVGIVGILFLFLLYFLYYVNVYIV
jgi:protein arginine N-methyltransferase 5